MQGGRRTAGMMYCQNCCRSRFSPLFPAHSQTRNMKRFLTILLRHLNVKLSCVRLGGKGTGNTGFVHWCCRCQRPLC
jgi:hypothetical protein